MKCLETALELIARVGAWNNGHDDSTFGRPNARYLCSVARAERSRSRESKACQAFEGRALARGLVTDNDNLRQADLRSNVRRPKPIYLGEEGIVSKTVTGRHYAAEHGRMEEGTSGVESELKQHKKRILRGWSGTRLGENRIRRSEQRGLASFLYTFEE